METALKETIEVETKALSIVDQAKAVKIIDAETYTAAGGLWKAIKDMMKEVSDTFDPLIEANHKAHKAALEKKAKFYAPLDTAYRSVKQLMSAYDLEQERIRKAEQDRLAAIARKIEEERILQEAAEAEADARANGATKEEAAQVADAVIAEPIYVAPIIVAKSTPKLAGGPVYRTIWKFEIIDEAKIPRQYLIPDEKAIGGVIRSSSGKILIPGVRAYEERV